MDASDFCIGPRRERNNPVTHAPSTQSTSRLRTLKDEATRDDRRLYIGTRALYVVLYLMFVRRKIRIGQEADLRKDVDSVDHIRNVHSHRSK